ncbi:uncharacterized protein LOC133789177 [Humulus lupulus]|uniref:uncharacterized protein LOC133789177 n=1 Tax=Humulus lupulus TaxID=3486 RepID=UPI002B410429|nr:uncharacterized protein LOC133789177 [Humulus lupulus]
MAVASNKSPSPISGRANPNARSSEIGNSMRRSFTGNPFSKPSIVPNPRGLNPNTPANSPSDYPRRSSVSRENITTLRDNDDKENAKVAARVRSPMAASKGTKNFMSPTISAASKFTPSPRKKVLEERNEPVRASLSFSEVKLADSEHKKESFSQSETVTDPLSFKKESGSIPKKVTFKEPLQCFDNVVIEEADLVNLDPTFKISPPAPPHPGSSSSIPIIAPLDSDPLAPPYDPKTNYLSPRPRFLRFKPNPRVELFLNNLTSEGKSLEDSFSDTDITTEEEILSDYSQKDLDDVSSNEAAKEEEEEAKEELIVSEPSPIDAKEEAETEEELNVSDPSPIDIPTLEEEEETVEAKGISTKPHSIWRSKLTSLLIVLSFFCLAISVSISPVTDETVFDSSTLLKQYDHGEVMAFAKARFDGLAQNFGVWYAHTVSVFFELFSNLRGAHKLGPLQYYNLTSLVEDARGDSYEMNVFASRGRDIVTSEENVELETEAVDSIFEAPEMNIYAEYVEQVSLEADEAPPVDAHEVHQASQVEVVVEPENSAREQLSQEVQPQLSEAQDESDTSFVAESEIEPVSEDFGNESPEIVDASSPEDAKSMEEPVNENEYDLPRVNEIPETVDASFQDAKSLEVTVDGNKYDLSTVNVLGMALCAVLALIASTVFMLVKKGNNNNSIPNVVPQYVTKKVDSTPILPERLENSFEVRHSSWTYSGESCSSEMSSFQNYERRKPSTNNNHRRESMASSSMEDSSMGSPSYGSFTTYEKIPIKSGHIDELITPVRRSSRLRSQVTSP